MQRYPILFRASASLPAMVCCKSFSLLHAHHLLDEIPQKVTSNPIGTIQDRLRSGEPLDPTSVAMAFKASRGKTGSQMHKLALSLGLDSFLFVSNSLMNMYYKSGFFDDARKVFVAIPDPDVVSWNTVLSGFTCGVGALDFVLQMHRAGILFDAVTFTAALAFTSDLQDLEFGLQLHSLTFKSGFDSDTFVGNALITAYSRSGCIEEARRVFDEMATRDSISWNALISGLTQEGDCGHEAILIFSQMLKEDGVRTDHVAFASAISACCQEENLELGTQVHGFVVKVGLEAHVSVSNVLMAMYYKQGSSIDKVNRVFENMRERNVISWTTMISVDTKNSFSLFNRMRLDDVLPNDVTFIALINAVVSDEHLPPREGQMIHGMCFVCGIAAELNVSNSLITMYAKLGSIEESRKIFESIEHKEIISWNAMISGYAQKGLCEEALETFSSLLLHSKPNQYTFGSILSAISGVQTVSLSYGQRCHSRIVKSGLDTDEYVSGALIDLYAKRGGIDDSQKVFDETTQRSLVSWTAIISAHAKHGSYENVMSLFEDMVMKNSGVRPDHITFLAVLTACGCKGMVDMGRCVFNSMVDKHVMEPWPEHYACMVDMLGRAGRLAEAEEFIKEKVAKGPGVSALQSLLGACRVHGNVEMGERVAKVLMDMEPMESGAYVLMSNMYAEKGEWENVAKIRRGMRNRGVKKEVGFSWVDIGVKDSMHVHKFSSDDKTHPLSEEIYRMADCLGFDMKIKEENQPVV